MAAGIPKRQHGDGTHPGRQTVYRLFRQKTPLYRPVHWRAGFLRNICRCLPFSDYAFAIAVPSQQPPDFLYALSCCLEVMGGVPKAIVPDNLKAAVIKADKYEPILNQSMEDFANHYGTVVVPGRSGKPKDKSLVENQVKMIYTRVFAPLRNRQFFDIHSLNDAIRSCILKHNQTRMQQKAYCRKERFLNAEKSTLDEPPKKRFELKYYAELKVGNTPKKGRKIWRYW